MISTIRHNDLFNTREHNNFVTTVIGAGAIGSRVFESLVQLGLTNIRVYDPDIVEAHNIANQAFDHAHIGQFKVDACANIYKRKTGAKQLPDTLVFCNNYAELASTRDIPPPEGIVFLCVDSFKARQSIYSLCLGDQPHVFRVIDTRMASTHGNVLAFDPHYRKHAEQWEATIGSDEPDKSELSACGSAMSVGPTAAVIANIAVWEYMHFMQNPAACSERINVFLKPFGASAQ